MCKLSEITIDTSIPEDKVYTIEWKCSFPNIKEKFNTLVKELEEELIEKKKD
jgi:hypothetical protein